MTTGEPTFPWKIDHEEFTSTDHPTTIERTLNSIHNDRLYVTLVSDPYRSAETVLAGIDIQNIRFDRPIDWQESTTTAKVYFRDIFKVWNFFQVQISSTNDDTIYTSHPKKIHRLQRRRHFRISPPEGSYASFIHEEQKPGSATIDNISASGMLISTEDKMPFPDDKVQLKEIMIMIPSRHGGSEKHMLLTIIEEGEIVRLFSNESTRTTYFGISFSGDHEIKDEISKYVIKREQEILRHKLNSENEL